MAIISNAVTIADAGAFSVSLGSKVHIKTLTASSSATLSFLHGTDGVILDSTYPIYEFEFINIHADTDTGNFTFNGSVDSGSNYNVTKTSTTFYAAQSEGGGSVTFEYNTNNDLAQSTAYQRLIEEMGSDSDQSGSGTLTIYNPSDTTFVKHFIARCNNAHRANYTNDDYCAGYMNTTSAVNAIRFQMSSGTFDGKIKLYGIKDS